MNRSSFIKSFICLIAAPKILAEIEFKSNQYTVINSANSSIITDLQLITPEYYNKYIEKYGSENYELFKQILGT